MCERVDSVLDDIIEEAIMEGGRKFSNRLERRMKAEKKRLELMKHLESWWSTLEGGMPELKRRWKHILNKRDWPKGK